MVREGLMRTIETRGTVSKDRKLTIDVPADVAPGEHQVIVVIADDPNLYSDRDEEPVAYQPLAPDASVLSDLGIVALPWRAWPAYATFRRKEIYGDDGR
jgi:hypothetical protein